jgi:hypothetical protein
MLGFTNFDNYKHVDIWERLWVQNTVAHIVKKTGKT